MQHAVIKPFLCAFYCYAWVFLLVCTEKIFSVRKRKNCIKSESQRCGYLLFFTAKFGKIEEL
jgi:hypothetical protein